MAKAYVYAFHGDPDLWPIQHRIYIDKLKFVYNCNYDYKKKRNLFNLLSILKNQPVEITGIRRELEVLVMYFWLEDVEDDNTYLKDYLKNKI